jgi:hypothetical protein
MPNGIDKVQFTLYLPEIIDSLIDEIANENERTKNTEIVIAIREYLLRKLDKPNYWLKLYQERQEASKL